MQPLSEHFVARSSQRRCHLVPLRLTVTGTATGSPPPGRRTRSIRLRLGRAGGRCGRRLRRVREGLETMAQPPVRKEKAARRRGVRSFPSCDRSARGAQIHDDVEDRRVASRMSRPCALAADAHAHHMCGERVEAVLVCRCTVDLVPDHLRVEGTGTAMFIDMRRRRTTAPAMRETLIDVHQTPPVVRLPWTSSPMLQRAAAVARSGAPRCASSHLGDASGLGIHRGGRSGPCQGDAMHRGSSRQGPRRPRSGRGPPRPSGLLRRALFRVRPGDGRDRRADDEPGRGLAPTVGRWSTRPIKGLAT